MSVLDKSLKNPMPSVEEQLSKAIKDLRFKGYDVNTLSRIFRIKGPRAHPTHNDDNKRGNDENSGSEMGDQTTS